MADGCLSLEEFLAQRPVYWWEYTCHWSWICRGLIMHGWLRSLELSYVECGFCAGERRNLRSVIWQPWGVFTRLIIIPVTNADGVIQVCLRQAIAWHRTHGHADTRPNPLSPSLWRVPAVHLHIHSSLTLVLSPSPSQITSCLTVAIYGSITRQALSISSLALPTVLSFLSLPLEHLNHSDQMCLSILLSLYPPLCFPHAPSPPPLTLTIAFLLLLPPSSSFSLSFWSALRVLFIQQQPTQSRAEQNRAARGVWLAKVGITSETQQNSFTPSMLTPHHNFQQKYHGLRNTFIITTGEKKEEAQASSGRSRPFYRSYLLI